MNVKSRRRAAMSIFVAGVLLLAAPHAVQAGPRDPPPKELCSDPTQEGNTVPYPPMPEFFEWKCFCYQVLRRWKHPVGVRVGARSQGEGEPEPGVGLLERHVRLSVRDQLGDLRLLRSPDERRDGPGARRVLPLNHAQPRPQPPGQLRSHAVFEYYAGTSWYPCTPLGYSYNTVTTNGVSDFFNMGSVPDCGSWTYRLSNTIGIWEGNAWRGGTLWAPNIFMN